MLRRLRYAPAVVFALLALAFVSLWVRSYTYMDGVGGPLGERFYGVATARGLLRLYLSHASLESNWGGWHWEAHHAISLADDTRWGFGYVSSVNGKVKSLYCPLLFLAASSLALAVLLAFKPITRFTVRGLLIATTLLAAVLGAVVYAL
jgi:hypothetical protein